MANRTIYILMLGFMVLAGAHLQAQQKGKGKPPEHSKGVLMPNVYLGHSENKGGPIQKDVFVTLMKQGLTSHDMNANPYRVVGFDFSYSEQKLYEDSAGNPVMMRDLSSEYCPGDTLSPDIAYARNMLQSVYLNDSSDIPKGLYDRIKPGDTLYFDHIRLVEAKKNSTLSLSDTTTIAGKGMKFVIVK